MKIMNRKEFIQTFLRGTILVAIGVFITIFASRGKISMNNECTANEQCKACGKVRNCALPGADKFRRNGKG
jgi:hypothetical protein